MGKGRRNNQSLLPCIYRETEARTRKGTSPRSHKKIPSGAGTGTLSPAHQAHWSHQSRSFLSQQSWGAVYVLGGGDNEFCGKSRRGGTSGEKLWDSGARAGGPVGPCWAGRPSQGWSSVTSAHCGSSLHTKRAPPRATAVDFAGTFPQPPTPRLPGLQAPDSSWAGPAT